MLSSRTLTERTGVTVALKAENLQRTGSFKLRGALAKIAALGECLRARGGAPAPATTPRRSPTPRASAGLHCEVFMPESAPMAKVEAAASLGAEVRLVGESVDESLSRPASGPRRTGCAFVHPFDDPDGDGGPGRLGLELLEQVPDMGRVVVPVGGGGLISGVAMAIKSARPEVEVIGVQVRRARRFSPRWRPASRWRSPRR